MIIGLMCVVAVPFIAIVRQDIEWTKPDTRLVAKQWIESNIPSGAKILADGYQYRFIPSPPLTPQKTVVDRQIAGVSEEADRFRGASQQTLKFYAEAMESVQGPTYDLHSTVWGLAVKDPIYYAQRCFDYIITSSYIAGRYARGINQQRFPTSANFYNQLDTDPSLRKIYSVKPVSWERSGPTITIYRVVPVCQTSRRPPGNPPGNELP
jgi:hypothetical protein